MQYQYILLLLYVEGVMIISGEETSVSQHGRQKRNSISPKQVSKRSIQISANPKDVVRQMYDIQAEVTYIAKGAYAIFGTMEGNIATRHKHEKSVLTKDINNIKALARSKESKEMEKAKEEGHPEDAHAIEFCVQTEQERYQKGLDSDLIQSMMCLNHMTKTAHERADHARRTFNNKSPYSGSYDADMRKKWYFCALTDVEFPCIRKNIAEIQGHINLSRQLADTTTKMSREADQKHKEDMKICQAAKDRDIKERQEEHAKGLQSCVENPEGKKPWALKWVL